MPALAPLTAEAHPVTAPLTGYKPKTRDDLLMLATRRFCAAERHTRLSSDQFKEAFYLLIDEVNEGTKERMSEMLSVCDYTPKQIAVYFALEEMSISRPMLSNSNVLGQLDFLLIVDSRSHEHATAIASRPDVGPTLVQRLRRLSSASVNKALSENYALLDQSLQKDANSLFKLIDKRTKREEIVETEETNSTGVSEANTNVQPEMTLERSNARISDDNSELNDAELASAQTSSTSAEQALLAAAARGARLPKVSTDVSANAIEADFDLGKGLEKAAQARSHQAIATLMQKKAGISLVAAFQALGDKTGETLCVFMRAYNLNEALASRILILTFPSIGLSVRSAMRCVRFYDQLTVKNCKAAVAQWPKTVARHQPYLEEGSPVRDAPRTSVKQVEWASERNLSATG